MKNPLPIAIFASGGGTNFQALLDYEDESSYRVDLLITDQKNAGVLERARKAGRRSEVLEHKGIMNQQQVSKMQTLLKACGIEFIALAGYLRKIPAAVVSGYPRRIVNIHPALLPSFGGTGMYGQHVHQAVLKSGKKVTGPTVHYVDEDYDTGEIIAQVSVPVMKEDDFRSLESRVVKAEHLLYPAVVDQLCRALAEGRYPKNNETQC